MTHMKSIPALIACVLLAVCCRSVEADEMPQSAKPDDAAMTAARDLAGEVLGRAGGADLGDWTRSILDRALRRAGERARQTIPATSGRSTMPASAERHAGTFSARHSASAQILLFTSLSVPAASWREWARDAERTGAPLVLRGVGEGGLRAMVTAIGGRLGDHDAGVTIDPRLFRLFRIERVPAVIVVPGGVPPCASRGCGDDAPPPYDLVTGNIGLVAALEAVAEEGAVGGEVARVHLERMNGAGR